MSSSRRDFLKYTSLGAAGAAITGCNAKAKESNSSIRNVPLDRLERENVKITDVRVRLFSHDYPLEKWWYGAGVTILTEVETDKGITGIGCPIPYGGPEFVKEYTETAVKAQLIGKNPFDLEVIAASHRELNKAMASAGINVAC